MGMLDSINTKGKLDNPKSPLRKNREKTTPLRVKLSKYEKVRKIAFKQHTSMTNVLDQFITKGVEDYNREHKNDNE